MAYVAHAAVELASVEKNDEVDKWHYIDCINGIEFRWKYDSNCKYHVIGGVFNDPQEALNCAKGLYVCLFYRALKGGCTIKDAGCNTYEPRLDNDIAIADYNGDESFFFWNKQYMGGELGPGVFEVEQSIDEFDDYRFITGVLSVYYDCDLDFGKIDEYSFIYCRKSQELFDTIMLAENAADYGMKMTIYCGLLEHLSESGKKEKEVVDMIDCLINSVNQTTTLTKVQKDSLRSYLKNGKEISPRQKCKRICKKYAKESYHGVLTNSIIDNAYNNRSAFAHGDDIDYNKITYAQLLKLVVLDVVEQYMINLQNIKTTSQ